ncbi:MerR family transcriptional regulator [Brevundimonas lenta]|uniref:DNA-binding transcriptional MerR regulator n=1 Tax=Brevundimonas lenta TaxID=424796 RepID=A0A7W6JD22_9CAUL|nr:DNA-binding transcriptional MerR regulator [Brevundimonas lenta]
MTKSPNAFRTISEAADEVGAPQHVLRFWETKFTFITPLKRAGGRRFYRQQDIVLLKAVKRLLHEDGLTIKGVQRLHKEQGVKRIAAYGDPEGLVSFEPEAAASTASAGVSSTTGSSIRLRQVLAELEGARARLEAVLSRSA